DRRGKKGLGFGAEVTSKNDQVKDPFQYVEPEDLVKFGLIPEVIGRLPVVTHVGHLDEDALVQVLTEPKNALVRQYQRLFEMDNVQLAFEDGALREVARQALARETGARGLRSIMERILLPIMYSLPEEEDIAEVLITEAAAAGGGRRVIAAPAARSRGGSRHPARAQSRRGRSGCRNYPACSSSAW